MRFTARGVRETERPVSFIPKGALTHHLRSKRWYACGIVRSPRGMRLPQYFILLEALMDNATSLRSCCHRPRSYRKHNRQCDCVLGYGLYPILRQLPAKTLSRTNPSDLFNSFIAVMDGFTPPIFFLRKRNKNRGRKDGENEWRFTTWKRKL